MDRLKSRILGTYLRVRETGKGQGYTEYVVLLALIAIVAYVAVRTLGQNVSTAMNSVGGSI
jgi:Flp pilus assembly pilin Flp